MKNFIRNLTPSVRRWLLGAAAFLLATAAVMAGINYLWHGTSVRTECVVEIPSGEGTAQIAQRLQAAGIVRNARLFRYFVILTGRARELQAGEYAFPARPGMKTVAGKLANGEVVKHAVTIPEGFTARQIAEKLEQEDLVQAEAFMAIVNDPALAKLWNVPADNLEGFLFPDTYYLVKSLSARRIARRMVVRFWEKQQPGFMEAGKKQGLNFLQLVILASIIEREVLVPEERARVASVFYNRLRSNKRLESCATVLYSQGRTSGALSWDDLYTRSSYNTYRHRGLPPGPICSPGLSALRAAAYPAETKYLFFVVRPSGRHIFSEDFEAHKRAKWAQQQARRFKPRPSASPTP
ncbi:endolytic transglycosylase MltG [bacterium]|nr:endolytic transglycosylase MltG [bacterium]